jgi:hypothetical protein
MVSTVHRTRDLTRWAGCLILVAGVGDPAAFGQESPAVTAISRVRPVDRKAAALLEAGNARSATFRLITQTLEQSDLFVYVETCTLTLPGQLQFVSAKPGARYVRVSVRQMGIDNDLIPWLAHELWHATEIAGAPEVRDRAGLLRLYARIGHSMRANGGVEAETVKAQETQESVLRELRRGN